MISPTAYLLRRVEANVDVAPNLALWLIGRAAAAAKDDIGLDAQAQTAIAARLERLQQRAISAHRALETVDHWSPVP